MKASITYIGFLGLLLLSSCSKSSDSAGSNHVDDFKFYFNAEIDGQSISMHAGDESYTLNTDYSLQENGILSMSGVLNNSVDGNYKNAVMLRLRGVNALETESNFNLNTDIPEGLVALTDDSNQKRIPGEYKIDLTPTVVSNDLFYFWNFQDSTTSTDISPSIMVQEEDFGIFTTSLSADPHGGGCESRSTHKINITQNCDATVIITTTHGSGVEAKVFNRSGENIQSVEWFREGVLVGNDSVLDNLTFNSDGNYRIAAEVSFESGCVKTIVKELSVLSGSVSFCDIDFSYSKSASTVEDPLQLGTIELVYYDADGIAYSSFYEGTEGRFKIHSFRDFEINENGQKTVRFLFEGNDIELRNDNGQSLMLNNTFGNFAVAYP